MCLFLNTFQILSAKPYHVQQQIKSTFKTIKPNKPPKHCFDCKFYTIKYKDKIQFNKLGKHNTKQHLIL